MSKVTLIAEVASNHGGSRSRAMEFVDSFAHAGADIIKFQYTHAERLSKADPQYTWFAHAHLTITDLIVLREVCRTLKIECMATIYHPDDIIPFKATGLEYLKIGAGESHKGKLAAAVLATSIPHIYVSEGIYPVHESYKYDERVRILGTVSRYPAPPGRVGFRWKPYYVGWSDHCVGLGESMAAVDTGATIIERHVQLKTQARPPRPFESTVEEFAELRAWVDADPKRFIGRWDHAADV